MNRKQRRRIEADGRRAARHDRSADRRKLKREWDKATKINPVLKMAAAEIDRRGSKLGRWELAAIEAVFELSGVKSG